MLAVASPASAKKDAKKATFKLTARGEQTNTSTEDWTVDPGQTGDEPVPCHAEGSEHVSFATPGPVKVKVKMVSAEGSGFPWFSFGPGGPAGWGDPSFQVKADVERRSAASGDEFDCGFLPDNCTRSARGVDWRLLLFGAPGEKNRITLEDDDTREQPDPFPDCRLPQSGPSFPALLLDYGSVSWRKLFKRRAKRITAQGASTESEPAFAYEAPYTASLSYTISLKRVRK